MAGAYLWGWDESAGTWVKCKVTADGKLVINPTGFLENPPTEDEDKKAPTSEWAYDHENAAGAHHSRYTDTESRAAIGNLFNSSGYPTRNIYMAYKQLTAASGFGIKWGSADDFTFNIHKDLDEPLARARMQEAGVGYVDFDLMHHNGSVDKPFIHQGTFQAFLATLLETSPTEDVTNKAPTSEWAYDHKNDESAHHTKYYDKEAVDAFQSRDYTMEAGTYDDFNCTNYSLIWLDSSSGDINLRGMSGGYSGKIVFFVRTDVSNQINLYHAHATPATGDKFYVAGGDKNMGIAAYGAFIAIYKSPGWQVMFGIP